MTDRDEAVRVLAEIVADICARMELPMSREVARQVARSVALDAPAAPTVTREQAEWVLWAIGFAIGAMKLDPQAGPAPVAPGEATQPAFFRAVADALEGE